MFNKVRNALLVAVLIASACINHNAAMRYWRVVTLMYYPYTVLEGSKFKIHCE